VEHLEHGDTICPEKHGTPTMACLLISRRDGAQPSPATRN
jgi:hypothetical protein